MQDKEIIDLFFERNSGAINALKDKYYKYCYTIAYSILDNHEDSEECLNDTWYKVWNSIPPDTPKCIKPYIAKIIRNQAIDKFRADNSIKRGGCTMDNVLSELDSCLTANANPVEDTLIYEELENTINKFVRKLPEKQGDIFIRRYFFCEDIAEIALRYNIAEKSVTSSLTRTRKKLKKYLIEEGFIC